ncbi:MAG: alpha/beta fold hydrolase [Cellvibrionaceae bacterium]
MKLNYQDTQAKDTAATETKATTTTSNTDIPVILMHGMFGSLSNLGVLARPLTEAGYRVISVDLRNHGLSPHEHDMSYAHMAADIVELLDDLQLSKAYLLGHSMGGKVGMQVAMNYPDRVAKLIVADISPVTYSVDRHGGILEGLRVLAANKLTSRQHADQLLAEYEADKGVRAFLLKNLYRKDEGHFGLRLNLDSVIANYCDVLTQAPTGNPFEGETLFLKGENSAYIQEKHRDEVMRLFPEVQLKVIADTGHWLHAEKPEMVSRQVLSFLNS